MSSADPDGPPPSGRDFAEFYAATFAVLTVQLHAFTGSHADAQDLAQEALLRAYARWSTVGAFDDPVAWVRRVAWNLAISRWRRARRLLRWKHDLAPAAVAGPSGVHIDLARALARLSPLQRQAVVLHYLADLPVRDIAEFMGVAEGTIKAWLHRARVALRSHLGTGSEEVTHA